MNGVIISRRFTDCDRNFPCGSSCWLSHQYFRDNAVLVSSFWRRYAKFGPCCLSRYRFPDNLCLLFPAWVIRVSCFAVLAFNVYMNWYKMIKIGPSGLNPALPNVVKAGFRWASAYVYLAFLLLGYVSGSASFPSTSLGKRNFSVRSFFGKNWCV